MDGDNKAVLDLRIRQGDELRFRPPKMITYLRNNMETPVNGIIPQAYPALMMPKDTPTIEKAKDLVNEYKRHG
jgi:peptide/nickel transport system substrate-binding protein